MKFLVIQLFSFVSLFPNEFANSQKLNNSSNHPENTIISSMKIKFES